MESIPGWPDDFYRNNVYGAACHICNEKVQPMGVYRKCPFKHNACGTCFSKFSFSQEKKIHECPKCIHTRMRENKKNMTMLMAERSFVNDPKMGPGVFRFSEEAARKKAKRDARESCDILKKKLTGVVQTPRDSIESIDDDDGEAGSVKKFAQKPTSSSSSTLRIEEKGRVVEYVKVKPSQLDDCDCCKHALCVDCIWVVSSTLEK